MIPIVFVVFAFVGLLAALYGIVVFRMSREITFFSSGSDNSKQSMCAAKLKFWEWPSVIHDYPFTDGRCVMKMFFVVLLGMIQRIFKLGVSERSLVLLCAISNFMSVVLVFLIGTLYWDMWVGLFASILLLIGLWPWLLVLHGGPICLSQTCFLFSVFSLQLAGMGETEFSLVWYGIAGIAATLTQYSSGSARKYIPMFFGAFLCSHYSEIASTMIISSGMVFSFSGLDLVVIFTTGVLGVCVIGLRLGCKWILKNLPPWLKRMARFPDDFDFQRNERKAEKFAVKIMKLYAFLVFWVVLGLLLVRSQYFYQSQIAIFIGFSLVVFWFTYPNVIKNLYLYYALFTVDKWGARFPLYIDFFANRNQPIAANMRGAGVKWLLRYFSLMMPCELILVVVYLVLLVIDYVFLGLRFNLLLELLAITILSFSPIIVAEVTRGPQLGRTNYPAYPGIILFITYAAYQISHSPLWVSHSPSWGLLVFWVLTIALVLFSAIRSAKIFIDDVWPARMAPAWLNKALSQLGVNEFFTYDTPYNAAFVGSMYESDLEKYKIRYINNISEVKKGIIVIPGTSSKAFNMESQRCVIDGGGDFNLDKELNYLIETRKISNFAIARFQTFGTSRYWGHESEVVSYRDLILKDIDENDRWRGWAWILDAEKLHDWFISDEHRSGLN